MRADVGSRTPCAKPFWPSRPRRAGRGWAPQCVSERPMCANQQEGGVRSRCPHLTAPTPKKNRQQKQGWQQRQYCFSHHAWRERARGQEEEGWIKGVS